MRAYLKRFFIACAAFASIGACVAYEVEDSRGRKFEFDKPPLAATIVPCITQNIYAIGAQDNLVANSRYCVFPEDAKRKVKIGGFIDPDYEKIAALKFDIFILPHTREGRLERRLEKLGVKCFVLNPEGLKNISADVRMLGGLFRREREADKVASELDAVVNGSFDGGKNRRALFMFDRMAAGSGSFAGDILAVCGLKNCADAMRRPWAELPREFIVASNPEVIFAESPNDAASRAALDFYRTDPVWRRTDAVKNSRIYFVPRDLVLIPSARVAKAVKYMRACLSE